MNPSRLSDLLAAAFAAGVLVWLWLHFSYGTLPPLPWTAVPTLALLAGGELLAAVNTRARLRRRPGTRPINPLLVARLAVLAKASAYTAAMVAGGFTGVLVFVLPELSRGVGQRDAAVSGASLAAALVLAGVALFLEYTCRVPEQPDGTDRSPERNPPQ